MSKCGCKTNIYHGTYIRKVHDFPVFGKNVQLVIKAYEYDYVNSGYAATSVAENFNGFLNTYSRIPERYAGFICTLTLETRCEGCSRICKSLGINISGDTVIRFLLKRYESLPESETGEVIDVDDFAYKIRNHYCR